MQANELASAIETAWGEELQAARGPRGNSDYVYASQFSPCARSMVYSMTCSNELPAFPVDALARMERGNEIERDKLIYLSKIGQRCQPAFRLIGQQERFALRDHKGRVAIVGKVDVTLQFDNGIKAPLDWKAWSPLVAERIHGFDDLWRSPWTRKGAMQILSYLYGSGQPIGFLGLDRAGIPRLIPVELEPNLDRMEKFLSLAEVALDHKIAGTLPDFYTEAETCKSCDWYGGHCQPPLLSKTMAQILTDPDLAARLERREELKPAADEFDALDTQLKAELRGVEQAIAGPFLLEGKWQSMSKLNLPKELKDKHTVRDDKGKFVLTITKVSNNGEESESPPAA